MRVVQAILRFGIVLSAATLAVSGQGRDAAQVLAAAREALGGDAVLAAVKSFVATGRTRQIRGNNLVPIEFEINCELPDKFVRKDEFPAQDTDLTVSGFRGDALIQFPGPGAGRGGAPGAPSRGNGPNADEQRLNTVRQEFVRLTLGAFATSFPTYPLTFKYAAEAEAPDGKADVLDVSGPANFTARLLVQRETHLPVMLIWQMSPPPGPPRGAPPAGPGASAAPIAPPATAAPMEVRLYYADYRAVNGIRWPFRIRRAVGGTTTEETMFDRVNVNVRIDPRKFEAPK